MNRSPMRSRSSTASGIDETAIQAAGSRLRVELVLTAHPTEATRRTVLEAHRRIAALLTRLDDEGTPLSERRRLEDGLAEEITLLWQTDEIRSKRPRVVDEIRQGLWFFEQSFWNAIPELERALVERLAGRGGGASVRYVDRRRPRRQPERRAGDGRRRARARAPAGT